MLGFNIDRSINIKNCVEIAIGLEYIRGVSEVRYRLKTGIMTRPKEENKF